MKGLAAQWQEPTVVYICNPHNPTGTLTPSAEVDDWIASASENVFFVIDEAYFQLVTDSSYWSADKWVQERPNVLVARTFSKFYGMAGLRQALYLEAPLEGGGLPHPGICLGITALFALVTLVTSVGMVRRRERGGGR